MEIVLASRNKKKIRELETLLANYSSNATVERITVLSLDDIGYEEEIVENGSTFEENAFIKADTIAKLGYIAIADDSGLVVDALNGAPGIYSARYSGGGDEENNRKLLLELSGIPYEKRTARFVSSVVCVFARTGKKIVCTESCEGIILEAPRGTDGFGYDPLFYYPLFGKTFAEISQDEKNSVSHRGKAMRAFIEKFTAESVEK